jgi:thioredoxin-related protein
MKIRIIAILALSLMVGSSFKAEEGIKWLDFNKGYELAKKKNKIMIVDVYTEWCGWCKRMDKDAYEKPNIINAINEDFIPVKFNPEINRIVFENMPDESFKIFMSGPVSRSARTISTCGINFWSLTRSSSFYDS